MQHFRGVSNQTTNTDFTDFLKLKDACCLFQFSARSMMQMESQEALIHEGSASSVAETCEQTQSFVVADFAELNVLDTLLDKSVGMCIHA
ncbi:hypothetical protein BIW11_10280, partial [Tropilaelaps mercedesae]